jgi:GTP cyclohydrolase II
MGSMYYVEYQTDEYVYVIDTSITEKSVQEDAKNVVAVMYKSHNLRNRRLIYRDSYGKINEIKHENGVFIALSHGHSGIDLPQETEDFKQFMKTLEGLRIIGNLTEQQPESVVAKRNKKLEIRVLDECLTEDVLQNFLGQVYEAWKALETELTQGEFALTYNWIYDHKTKLWLCKVVQGKTPVLYLWAAEGFFRAVFYFTEKQFEAISALDISERKKESLRRTKPVGKLLPVLIEIDSREQLPDFLKIVKIKIIID